MGVIYQAHDPVIDRPVAIKLVRADLLDSEEQAEYIARFRREAQTAGRCAHPNIVAIYDFAVHDDNPFLAMELVEGASLAMTLRQHGRYAPADAVAIMLQVLDALDCAHAMGVVHRDVKPANILLTPGHRVKMTDFGIARFESSDLTQHGAMIGTPSYMAPEQCTGDAVDARSDLFSAGAVLYEMLAGKRPFVGRTATEVTYRLVHEDPPALQADPAVPPGLAAVLQRALAKRPQDRFASARAMAEALRPALTDDDATVVTRSAATRSPAPAGVPAAAAITPAELAAVERALAQHLGPIAKVLVKRAAPRATSAAALWQMLAAEIGPADERAAFLRQRTS
jgi:serine/threonine-protein kinase